MDYTSYGDGVIISKGSYEASHTVGKWTPYIAYYNLCQIKKWELLRDILRTIILLDLILLTVLDGLQIKDKLLQLQKRKL